VPMPGPFPGPIANGRRDPDSHAIRIIRKVQLSIKWCYYKNMKNHL